MPGNRIALITKTVSWAHPGYRTRSATLRMSSGGYVHTGSEFRAVKKGEHVGLSGAIWLFQRREAFHDWDLQVYQHRTCHLEGG